MAASELIFAIFITAVAVSYGWGMRGCVIGGEKGAMLPGALLGLFLAKFSGIPIISQNCFLFSAVTCLGMGYGGFETYAQTMEMVLNPKSDIYNPKRGYIGLMLKGANWFGICGILLGMSFTDLSGNEYGIIEIIVLCAIIPLLQSLGIRIFNKPYDKSKNIFPKIYFSRNRREEWGGNLLTLLVLMLATVIKSDWYAFFFGVTGIISGAIGWAFSIWLYKVTALPMKNGEFVFGKAQKNGFIDNWKIMEFSLGFIGGGGLAAYFFLKLETVKTLFQKDFNCIFGNLEKAIAWTVFGIAMLMSIQYFIKNLQKSRIFELTERAVYFSLILCFVMLGNKEMAQLTVFLLILWVITEKTVFDRDDANLPKYIKIGYILVFVSAVLIEIILNNSYPLIVTMLMYTFYYIFTDVIFTFCRQLRGSEKCMFDKFKGCILTYIWFSVLSVIIIFAILK